MENFPNLGEMSASRNYQNDFRNTLVFQRKYFAKKEVFFYFKKQ